MAQMRISDDSLIQALSDQGLAEAAALRQLLEQQRQAYLQTQLSLSGTALLVDLTRRMLVVRELPSERILKEIPLAAGGGFQGFNPNEWTRWGSHALVVSPEDGSRLGEFDWQTGALYGLFITQDKKTYLYNEGRLDGDYLPLSQQALFGGVFKGNAQAAPYDLYLAGRWLCVSDRGAGTLIVIDAWNYELKGAIELRDPGRTHSLNLAIDDVRDLAYISDNQGTSLQILNLRNLELRREKLSQGVLGNLALTPDGRHLYAITLKPEEGLICLNTQTWTVEKTIKLKGHLFKVDSSDPCDLISLSPDGKTLLIMTYLNDPQPLTPVVSVIDAVQAKTLKRYSLKDGVKPFQLTFAQPNPLKPHTRSLEELIIAAGLIEPARLFSVKHALQVSLGGELPTRQEVAAAKATDVDISAFAMRIELPERQDADKLLNAQPVRGKRIELPPEAIDEIMDILVTTFQKQIDEDITGYEDVMKRLREEAEKTRNELEEYDSAIVQIEGLFEGRNLQTAVLREAILVMLDLKETVKKTTLKTAPNHCPNCKQTLLGAWDCEACGFELESPERALKRRIASAEATANLALGHVVIPDPQGLRLLQLNPYKYVVWHLDPDQLSADYPVDALWLPNNNVLAVDRDGHKVIELGGRGKLYWQFDTHASPAHKLREPVKATYYLPEADEMQQLKDDLSALQLLIVDQGNHRVLEVNRRHEILREFGIMGEPGSDDKHLLAPSDVQFTHDQTYLITDTGNHRLLEFNQKGALIKTFAEGLGLNRPSAAQRLFNDHTLVLDAGNYRLLELDPAGKILHETLYYTRAIDEKYRVVSPLKMIRLINKDIIIMDEDKLIQVRLNEKRLIWYSMIEAIAFQPKVGAAETFIDENGVEQKVYKLVDHGHLRPVRLSQKINFKRMQKLIEARLRNELADSASGEDDKTARAADRLRALIEDRKLEQKRSLQQELSLDTFQPSEIFEKAGSELVSLRTYCLDRNHNAVIRINRKGEVKWHFGFEMGQKLARPYHLSETKRSLLISDTGNNRVIELSKADKEVIMEFRGPADSPLNGPRSALRLGMGRTLIADQRNKRLVELTSLGKIGWVFDKHGQISSPQYAEELENGHILFTDSILNSIREIDREGNLHWSFGSRIKGNGPGQLFAPEFATRLPDGNTLIADTRNNRVVEVNYEGREVWIYSGDPNSLRKCLNPVRCERLANGNTQIIYNNHREMIEVTPEAETIWYFKMGNDVFLPPVHGDARAVKQLVERLNPYYNPIEKRLIRSAMNAGMGGIEAHVTLMDNCNMKSVRASLIMMQLEQAGTVIKTFPSPEELLADKFGKHLIIAVILDPYASPEGLSEDISYLAEIEAVELLPILLDEPQPTDQAVAAAS